MNIRSRYSQISLAFAAMISVFQIALIIALLPEIRDVLAGTRDPHLFVSGLFTSFWAYLPFQITFIVLLFLPERRATRIVQAAALMGFGLSAIIFVTWREATTDLVYILGIVLLYKYGYLKRAVLAKVTLLISPLIAARVGMVFVGALEGWRALNQIAIGVGSIPILYWVFENELIATRRRADEFEQLATEHAPFVEFGRNVSGVVHDFKNDLGLMRSFGSLMNAYGEEPLPESMRERYGEYLDRIESRVRSILLVTRPRGPDEVEELQLAELIHATTYVFQANLEFKRVVTFEIAHIDSALAVRTQVGAFISILENTIRNSCEALVEMHGDSVPAPGTGVVSVEAVAVEGRLLVRVRDTGPGIPGCADCDHSNCLECPTLAPGFTSKPDGSGIGLLTMRRAAARIGAQLRMSTRQDGGVETEILLPHGSVRARRGEPSARVDV